MWPILLDSSEEECLKTLRRLELEAYGSLVSALRAQGGLTPEKLKLLKDTASALHITPERHRAEIRRAVNDEQLCTIAQFVEGPDTYAEWSVEGRRKVRLVPRVVPQTAFLAVARRVADVAQADNAKMPWPAATARPPMVRPPPQMKHEHEENRMSSKKRRRLSQDSLPPPAYVPPLSKHRLQKHGINKIQQVYKSQSRISMRQPPQTDVSTMPPPRATIKTIPPVKQRVDVCKPHSSTASPIESTESSQKNHPVTVAKVVQPGTSLNKGLIKISQTSVASQQHQKLVIVSASQNINPNILQQNNSNKITTAVNTVKIKTSICEENLDSTSTPTKASPKIISSQVIVSKSQLTPLQTISMGEKPKVLTVQAKVRPQGSIIVPIQGQNSTNTGQFAGVSVPVLQGVQWKAIQGKSTVKLLPLSGSTKIIQKQGGGMGSGPIYVMSKPGNIIVNKTSTSASPDSVETPKNISNITHIRPLTAAQKTDDSKILVVRKAALSAAVPTLDAKEETASTSSDSKEERKSTVLQDALRASGVTNLDDDIESQISQYTQIPKNNKTSWATEDQANVNRPFQNLHLQDTKFLTLEEAVAILGDSSETRALLNQLQVESNSTDGQLDPQTGIYSPVPPAKAVISPEDTKLDIFSTAIASADIQLEEAETEFFETVIEEESSSVTEDSTPLTDKQLTDILTGDTNR